MKWTPWLFGSLTAALLTVGCGGDRRNNEEGTAGTGTETGTMQDDAGTTADTAIPQTGDTGATDTAGGARIHRDTNNPTGTGAGAPDTASAIPSDTVRPPSDTTPTRSQ